jgi:hypothetical protein
MKTIRVSSARGKQSAHLVTAKMGKATPSKHAKKFGGPLRDLTDPKVQESFKDADLKDSITKGKTVQKDGKELKMPATPEIAGDQLDGLVMFVRKLAKK